MNRLRRVVGHKSSEYTQVISHLKISVQKFVFSLLFLFTYHHHIEVVCNGSGFIVHMYCVLFNMN